MTVTRITSHPASAASAGASGKPRQEAKVTLHQGGDTYRIANARVQLKLSSLAHNSTRAVAAGSLGQAGLDMLCQSALSYVDTLVAGASEAYAHLRDALRRHASSPLRAHPNAPGVTNARNRLELASIAYAQTRVGADADINFSRAGLVVLCQASIGLAEALADLEPVGATGKPRIIDPTLHLDSGA